MNPRIVLLAAVALSCMAARPLPAELRIGAAAVKITPPKGIALAGYYHPRGADGTHDDLYAKALVIDQDNQKVALVCLDLISTTRSLTQRAREEIEKSTGIVAPCVMISATHAHTGPELADRGKRGDAMGASTELTLDYSARLPHLVAESVKLAHERRVPARLSAAVGREAHLSFNRRFYMRDGSVGWNPGKSNPDIVAPAGAIDPDVGVLLAEAIAEAAQPGGAGKASVIGRPGVTGKPPRPIATYVNFAMHPDTVGGTKFSADYPGALSRVLADFKGPDMVTVFANGACGNINHVDVQWPDPQKGPPEAHRIGVILGAAVMQTYKQLRPISPGLLRVKSEIVALPLPPVTEKEIEQARQDVRTAKDATRDGFMKLVRGFRALDVAARNGKPYEVEVQVIAYGSEVAWVSLPGEAFVELGLAIKKRSPYRTTMIAELANGSIGYIPDRRSYAEGNYEPASARCAAGSGEMLVEAAVRLLKELHAESLPR